MAFNGINAQATGQFRPRQQYSMASNGYANNGNPGGSANMPSRNSVSSGMQAQPYSSGMQQPGQGRYRPPIITGNGNGGPQWSDPNGMQYNLPNSNGGQGNYYGMQGQAYGMQGQRQSYGGDGGGYYNQGPSQGYGGDGGGQGMPSIMSSYGGGGGSPYALRYDPRRGNGSYADTFAMQQEQYNQQPTKRPRDYGGMDRDQYDALMYEQRSMPGEGDGPTYTAQVGVGGLANRDNWGQQGRVNNKGPAYAANDLASATPTGDPQGATGQLATPDWWTRMAPQSGQGGDSPYSFRPRFQDQFGGYGRNRYAY
jgi:hypothetical protein